MAGGVAGAMIDVEGQVADGDLIAILQPAVGFEDAAGDAILAAIVLKPRNPEAVGLMRSLDLDTEFLGERASLAAMVDMAVGDEDLFDHHAILFGGTLQLGQVAAGIDKGAAHR